MGGPIDLLLLRHLAVGALLGLLVGAVRVFSAHEEATTHFAGVRTFPLIGLSGGMAAHLSSTLGGWVLVAIAIALGGLLVASHVAESRTKGDVGVTTEMAAVAVFLAGALAASGQEQPAIIVGVTVTLLLSLKPFFARVTEKVERADVAATLKFCIVLFVVLPLLPDVSYGPFGGFNPRTAWKFVVLVSALGFGGYVLGKVAGPHRGLVLTALLGGIVSSTALTLAFSARSKEHPELGDTLGMGIVLASAAMFVRLGVAITIWNATLLRVVALPLGVMAAVSGVAAALLWWRARRAAPGDQAVKLKNPFELLSALKFGALVAVVAFAARAGQHFLGDAGLYLSGALAGVADVDAITLNVADMTRAGTVLPEVAARTIIFAVMMNTVAKGVMAWLGAARPVGRGVALAFGAVVAAGGITLGWLAIL